MSEPTGATPEVATAGDPSPAQAAHHEALNEIAQLEDLAQRDRLAHRVARRLLDVLEVHDAGVDPTPG